MTTTTHLSDNPQYADVGAHSTAGAIEAARSAVNAAITQTDTTIAALEVEGQKEIALADDAQREAAALENDPQAKMEAAGAGGEAVVSSARGQTIDLSTDKGVGAMNKAIAGQAKDIDAHAKDMSKAPGVYRHAPAQGTTNLTGSKIDTTGFALKGGGDDSSAGIAPKGKGVIETAQNHSVINGQSQAPAVAPALGPKLAAAPAGPGGMGGGATMVAQARSVNVQAPRDKIGQIMREDSARGKTPGNMSRSDYEGAEGREKLQNGDGIDRSQPVTPVAAAKNPYVMDMEMGMKPKGPTWSGGEKMGTGEEGLN